MRRYEKHKVEQTHSPSMDIGISSNFERWGASSEREEREWERWREGKREEGSEIGERE